MTTTIVNVTLGRCCCSQCSVVYWLTKVHRTQLVETGETFYCPSGHPQYFADSEINRLKRQLEVSERDRKYYRERREIERAAKESAQRGRAAFKGQVTKIKRRVGRGVCPCCNRQFKDLQRHMEGQHPSWQDDG